MVIPCCYIIRDARGVYNFENVCRRDAVCFIRTTDSRSKRLKPLCETCLATFREIADSEKHKAYMISKGMTGEYAIVSIQDGADEFNTSMIPEDPDRKIVTEERHKIMSR